MARKWRDLGETTCEICSEMNNKIFEVEDRKGRIIYLRKERWTHIRKKHQEVDDAELIKETLKNPDNIRIFDLDETINYYYKYFKHRKEPAKFLMVAVKFLNSKGFVKTAYFMRNIKK